MFPLVISTISLLLSIATVWLTIFRRGKLQMTQPILLSFLYDAGEPKVFFRALLYSTGKRGHIIEGMFLKVRRGESTEAFNYWMYGETKHLMIGSGLRVGEEGVVYNHHYLPPKGQSSFAFIAGSYVIEVFARTANQKGCTLLATAKILLTKDDARALQDKSNGIIFTWQPEVQCYHGQISRDPNKPASDVNALLLWDASSSQPRTSAELFRSGMQQ